MQNLPPVSIFIITCLDSAERCDILLRTCEVALQQNYPRFEVIVSENPGSIQAGEALASIHDQRLKVIRHEENLGCVGNINRCAAHCSYDVIKLLCDDDLLHPDYLLLTVPYVDDDTMVVADAEQYVIGKEPEGLLRRVTEAPEVERREPGYHRDIWHLSYASSCDPSAILFTKAMFDQLGGYDSNTDTDDWDFFIEGCLRSHIVHLKQTLCYIGVWPGSITQKNIRQPFFFPVGGLYTKFRIYHSVDMPAAERRWLLRMLFREWMFHSLRPLKLKNLFHTRYWKGYFAYSKRFLQLLGSRETAFHPRPPHTNN